MVKILKFNPATYVSLFYLGLLILLWIGISSPAPGAAQTGIAIIFLTLPWVMLLTSLENYLSKPDFDYLFPFFIVLSALLNAVIIHLFGALAAWLINLQNAKNQ